MSMADKNNTINLNANTQKIDIASLKELISLAYMSEMGGLKLYEELIKKGFEFDEFVAIKQIRLKGCELLSEAANAYKIELDDTFSAPVFVPDMADDALVVALNYELSIVALYGGLCEQCDDDMLRDLMFRLWATSQNEFVPALKNRLYIALSPAPALDNDSKNISSNLFKNGINGYQDEFNKLSQKLSKVVNGSASKDELAEVLNHPQFAFFSGAALGAVGLGALLANTKEENNDK